MDYPRQELAFRMQDEGFDLLLKRNCSISPAGLLCAYAVIAVATAMIALFFAVMGAWVVVPFAGLELVLLGVAFLWNARHAADYERIALGPRRLTVEVCERNDVRRHEFDPARARVKLDGEGRSIRVMLHSAGGELEIGRHLHEQARRELAGKLGERLRNLGI